MFFIIKFYEENPAGRTYKSESKKNREAVSMSLFQITNKTNTMKKLSHQILQIHVFFFLVIFQLPSYSQNINPIYGLGFSPYKDGQSPNIGSRISESQIDSLLKIIKPYTNWIRTYSCAHGIEKTGKIAHKLGLKIAAGAYLGPDMKANQDEINNLISAGKNDEIDIAVVGNEVFRSGLNVQQLMDYISQVKTALPNIKVTTGEIYSDYLKYPKLIKAVDFLLVHIYPFWENENIDCAIYFLNSTYEKVKTNAEGKEICIGEAGWASCGYKQGRAEPGPENASAHFLNFISWAKEKQVNYFYFEAFDESWKTKDEGTGMQGGCWGIWDKDGKMKPGMNRVFEGKVNKDNWMVKVPPFPSDNSSIEFTHVPGKTSNDWLEGVVKGVLPQDYKVAIYIKINGSCWTKPTFAEPLTEIDCDGTFRCNIFTGGANDKKASEVCAYLLPSGKKPGLMKGNCNIAIDPNKIFSATIK